MSNRFSGEGNLGQEPQRKVVQVQGEDREVCNLRVYFDRPTPRGDGEYEDRNGFWLDVELWANRGINAARVLSKGDRVAVDGALAGASYEKDEQHINKLIVKARAVNLVPTTKIESISRRVENDEAA